MSAFYLVEAFATEHPWLYGIPCISKTCITVTVVSSGGLLLLLHIVLPDIRSLKIVNCPYVSRSRVYFRPYHPDLLEFLSWYYSENQMNMASKWSLILKTHLFYCLVTVITAAGWNTSIEAAYFHFYFFTVPQEKKNVGITVCWKCVCTFSALYPCVCLCVFVDMQRCYIIPLTPLLSAECTRMGVKSSRCYT